MSIKLSNTSHEGVFEGVSVFTNQTWNSPPPDSWLTSQKGKWNHTVHGLELQPAESDVKTAVLFDLKFEEGKEGDTGEAHYIAGTEIGRWSIISVVDL